MALKGQQAKQEITAQILQLFGDSAFLYNGGKEIRINTTEDGAEVQIKIALTAAKTPVEPEEEGFVPQTISTTKTTNLASVSEGAFAFDDSKPKELVQPTEEEKNNVAKMMAALGL